MNTIRVKAKLNCVDSFAFSIDMRKIGRFAGRAVSADYAPSASNTTLTPRLEAPDCGVSGILRIMIRKTAPKIPLSATRPVRVYSQCAPGELHNDDSLAPV